MKTACASRHSSITRPRASRYAAGALVAGAFIGLCSLGTCQPTPAPADETAGYGVGVTVTLPSDPASQPDATGGVTGGNTGPAAENPAAPTYGPASPATDGAADSETGAPAPDATAGFGTVSGGSDQNAPDAAGATDPADSADLDDGTPAGPDMTLAEATGMPMAHGTSADPMEALLQVVARNQQEGSPLRIASADPATGHIAYE